MAVVDGATITKRNLIKIKRVPDLLVFTTLSPIMFVLLFAYVLGSMIDMPGRGYREYLIAGIFAHTVIFGSTWTGLGMAEDIKNGIIDRFRSLPMSPSAVLLGRTVSDVFINVISLVVMALTGLLVGWRIRTSLLEAIAGFAILLLFAYAVSWLMALVGLAIRTPEVYNNAVFIIIFPATFVANTFVDPNRLPTVLRVVAEWNPISAVVEASRQLFGNTSSALPNASTAWPMHHPIPASLLWTALLLVIFVPLAIAQYKKAVSR